MKQSLGFTLIELLVVIAISMIVSIFAIASFVTGNRRQELAASTQSVVGALRLAQERAAVGDKPSTTDCNAGPLNGYEFSTQANLHIFTVVPVCNTVSQTDVLNGKGVLSNDVSFRQGGWVRFKPISQPPSLSSGAAPLQLKLGVDTVFADSYSQIIEITPTGAINEKPMVKD